MLTPSIPVVPKLGAMAPKGGMGLLTGSHGRILNIFFKD